ncbi:MAG TPA: RNA polymerase sigma factor [Xanthobacteraceae bacterium]|nr:RNA polymerase sigma factor [Xanthobacteraceae bacterium]
MARTADPFRTLYDANHDRVRRMLARLVGAQDADDVAQAVFAKAAKALPEFRGDADPSTWLYRIAANAASDWLRSRATHEARRTVPLVDAGDDATRDPAIVAAEADPQPSPEQQVASDDTSACIRGEIARLADGYREVLMLSALGGLDDAQIAAILGITHGNAKVRLHRARQEFKKIIAARCDFYRNELSCKPSSPDCCPAPGPGTDRAAS